MEHKPVPIPDFFFSLSSALGIKIATVSNRYVHKAAWVIDNAGNTFEIMATVYHDEFRTMCPVCKKSTIVITFREDEVTNCSGNQIDPSYPSLCHTCSKPSPCKSCRHRSLKIDGCGAPYPPRYRVRHIVHCTQFVEDLHRADDGSGYPGCDGYEPDWYQEPIVSLSGLFEAREGNR